MLKLVFSDTLDCLIQSRRDSICQEKCRLEEIKKEIMMPVNTHQANDESPFEKRPLLPARRRRASDLDSDMVRAGEFSPNNFQNISVYDGNPLANLGTYEEKKRVLAAYQQKVEREVGHRADQSQAEREYQRLLQQKKREEAEYRRGADPIPCDVDAEFSLQPLHPPSMSSPLLPSQIAAAHNTPIRRQRGSSPQDVLATKTVEYSQNGVPFPRAPGLTMEERRHQQNLYRIALEEQIEEQKNRRYREHMAEIEENATYLIDGPDAESKMFTRPLRAGYTPTVPEQFSQKSPKCKHGLDKKDKSIDVLSMSPSHHQQSPNIKITLSPNELPSPRYQQEKLQKELQEQIEAKRKMDIERKIAEKEEEERIMQKLEEQQRRMREEYEEEQEKKKQKEEEKQKAAEAVWQKQQELQLQIEEERRQLLKQKQQITGNILTLSPCPPSPLLPTTRVSLSQHKSSPLSPVPNRRPISKYEPHSTKKAESSNRVLGQLSAMRQQLANEHSRMERRLRRSQMEAMYSVS